MDGNINITRLEKGSAPSKIGMYGAKRRVLANEDRLVADSPIARFKNAPLKKFLFGIIQNIYKSGSQRKRKIKVWIDFFLRLKQYFVGGTHLF